MRLWGYSGDLSLEKSVDNFVWRRLCTTQCEERSEDHYGIVAVSVTGGNDSPNT